MRSLACLALLLALASLAQPQGEQPQDAASPQPNTEEQPTAGHVAVTAGPSGSHSRQHRPHQARPHKNHHVQDDSHPWQQDAPGFSFLNQFQSCRMIVQPHMLTQPVGPPPANLPINTVLSIEMIRHPDLEPYLAALQLNQSRPHRKPWEFTHALWALHKLGVVTPDATGLALAAGHEPSLYYLSNHIKMMYAGDMYGTSSFAADGTAPADIIDHPERHAGNVAWRKDHLKMLYQDARNLSGFETGSLDFVMSLSSIEHFGGLDAVAGARESILEQARVVKKGGVVYLTTELILTGQGDAPGNGFNITQLHAAILQPAFAAGLVLVEPVHWAVSQKTIQSAVYLGVYGSHFVCLNSFPVVFFCLRQPPHGAAPEYRCQTTVALAFRKA